MLILGVCFILYFKIIMLNLILIILFLLSRTQDYMSLLSINQYKTTQIQQNILAKNLRDQCIGMNVKRKVRKKNKAVGYRYFIGSNCRSQHTICFF